MNAKRPSPRWTIVLTLTAAMALALSLAGFAASYPSIQECSQEEGKAKAGCCAAMYAGCARTCNGNGGCMGYCNDKHGQCMASTPETVQ
jgi:hypothetical protein